MQSTANLPVIGLDLVKSVFQLHIVDMQTGEIQRRQIKRAKLTEFFAKCQRSLVAMEACGTAHHWANPDLTSTSALLPNRGGQAMTRSNVTQRLALAVKTAALTTPSLAGRTISPHCLRHSTAMHLLQSGVDISVIALWLGHESPTTTHQYVEADLAMKEKALARLQDPNVAPSRFRADDDLLKFLKTL